MEMVEIVKKQRAFYRTGKTKSCAFRIEMLTILEEALVLFEEKLKAAFVLDLGKCKEEAELTEFTMAFHEIQYAKKHLKKWSRTKRVHTPITCAIGKSKIHREPYGVSLILSPWNYPLLLALDPLIGSITGGNCSVLKCSKSSAQVSAVIKEMIDYAFPDKYIYCAEPDRAYEEVLAPVYDYIFFTGSKDVGKIIMEKASKNLTPVSLELGGKSPCIVEKSADIPYAARRIIWGKLLNAGQTCIAPDYIFVDASCKAKLIHELTKQMHRMYPNPLSDEKYPKIINKRHFERLVGLIAAEKTVIGGEYVAEKMQICPTILPDATLDSPAMQNEIFGPILPILSYKKREEIFAYLEGRDKPLAFYLFSEDKSNMKEYMERISFGGGCVNDVIMHMVNENLPFGGVGASGMGAYHGKYNFDTFTREKSVLYKSKKLEIKAIYRPFTEKNMKFLNVILKK